MGMHQKDMERFAFLFLCGKRDREILLGKEKMTFSDLDRLTYVTDFLGLNLYNLEIWNKYSGQFGEQFRSWNCYMMRLAASCPGSRQKQMSICMSDGSVNFASRYRIRKFGNSWNKL